MNATEIVWVSIAGRASQSQGPIRFHAEATCFTRRGPRIPTIRAAAEAVGLVPCHYCVGTRMAVA